MLKLAFQTMHYQKAPILILLFKRDVGLTEVPVYPEQLRFLIQILMVI